MPSYSGLFERRGGTWHGRLVDAPAVVEVSAATLHEARAILEREALRILGAPGALTAAGQSGQRDYLTEVFVERINVMTARSGGPSGSQFLVGVARHGPVEDPTSPYTSGEGAPWPRDSIVCVLDELGAKRRIGGAPDPEELRRRAHTLRSWRDLLSDPAYRAEETLLAYTDNVLLAVPHSEMARTPRQRANLPRRMRAAVARGDTGKARELESELLSLSVALERTIHVAALYQVGLVLDGQLIRGGIAMGAVYIDRTQVLGPPILEAHELESSEADVPRVLLGLEAASWAQSSTLAEADPRDSFVGNALAVDGDGRTFVNYLAFHESVTDGSARQVTKILAHHAGLIQAGLRATRDQARACQKWRWSAEYHNWYCERLGSASRVPVSAYSHLPPLHPRSFAPFDLRSWDD